MTPSSHAPRCWMPSFAWASVGNEPSTGLSAPTQPMREKKRRDWLIQMAVNQPDIVLGFADEV